MTNPIRVLVVDDSTFMRGALVRMIERNPQFKVVGTAVNGREGVEQAQKLKPDVITMDVEMPEMNGIEALRQIMATVKIPVIMVSTLTESGAATTLQALELGAVDFIPKALNNKDNNIFKGADEIHAKIAAAAGAHAGFKPAPAAAAKAPAIPASSVVRVPAKIVLIGSSTGGPKALYEVIKDLPAGLPVPVLVAQHMPAQFTLALAKRLDEQTQIKVVEAKQGDVLMPGTVYIAPGGMHIRTLPNGVQLAEDKGESAYKPSVDVVGQSVLESYGKNVLAVMLTGMGNDGTQAYVKLKQTGAHIIAQDQASCVVYGMPRAVVEAGGASEVLPLDKIGGRIRALVG
jgi:two-component system, chemotaxis family, protein-glutamate methylesterase/glutaminase